MSQPELLKKAVLALTSAGIDYMVTGSLASSFQGEPRASHDIDLVVALSPEAVPSLLSAFPPPEYYLTTEAALDALRRQSMFNLLAVTTGEKVDFWVLTDSPFDQSRFTRKRVEEFLGMRLFVSAPEDTILMKLKWASLAGGSEKQLTDALRVYEVQQGHLEMDYLHQWARQLGVEELWQQLQAKAEKL
jgi:hypothetical protein